MPASQLQAVKATLWPWPLRATGSRVRGAAWPGSSLHFGLERKEKVAFHFLPSLFHLPINYSVAPGLVQVSAAGCWKVGQSSGYAPWAHKG